MIRLTRLIPIILFATCASAQVPELQRIEVLEEIGGVDSACWNNDGVWIAGGTCACIDPTDVYTAGVGCDPGTPPPPVCGNSVLEPPETCDDGNVLDGDGCSATCQVETPPPPTGVYDILAANLPPAGEFGLLPNSAIDVLVGTNEFPFCASIKCFVSRNAFLAWTGMAFDEDSGKWWNVAGGGHADYGGNEIYLFDFRTNSWTRPTDPQPLTGPPLNTDGTCPAPASGPAAKHTYDGSTFIPGHNEIFMHAGGGYCQPTGFVTSDTASWVWDVVAATWTELPAVTQASYTRSAYDAARDRVYAIGGPSKGTFYEYDPANGYALVVETSINEGSEGSARFDPDTRYLYFTNNSVGVLRMQIALDGTRSPKELIATWAQMGAPKMAAFDLDDSGKLVFWDGGAGVFRLDPSTGVTENIVPSSGVLPPSTNINRVYSKWNYIDAVGAFVGIDDPREGIWIYLPPSAAPVADNFAERCAASGVVLCDPLDTTGPYDGAGNVMLNPDGTEGLYDGCWWREWRGQCNAVFNPPALDTTVKASGTGSLKFVYPSNSPENGPGSFATNFTDDLSVGFGEGETFYTQFRWRANCDFVYFDCNPESATYKTARRFYASTDGVPTAAKLMIIEAGDPTIGESSDACTWMQIVLNHIEDYGLVGYHSCGWYESFKEPTGDVVGGSTQFDWQPNGDAACWWMPDGVTNTKKAWGYTGPNCWQLDADEWITIQVMVRVGTWQPTRSGPPNSHVSIWAAHQGQPQQLITDHDVYLRGPQYDADVTYGKIWFTPFMTHKDSSEVHPVAEMWFDELIVSTEFIADVGI